MIYILIILLILIILVILESIRELRCVKVTEYKVSTPRNITDKKIVFLTDYHEAKSINNKIIQKIEEIQPDVILFGGDMLNGKTESEDITPTIDLVNNLSEKFPVYYAMGNHETKVKADYYGTSNLWTSLNERLSPKVKMLINEKVTLDGIDVYGLDIPTDYYGRIKYPALSKDIINELLGAPNGEYTILLGHTPDFIDSYSQWGADLVLSGHFHGGIVRLPFLGGVVSPRMKFFPKYDYGRFEKNNSTMIVSNGLGQHSMKIRINNIPEVCLINLTKE